MLIKKIDDVPAAVVQMEGAKGVKVRVIFGPADDAPTFAMRAFDFEPGGNTPYHSHPFEHEVIVLQGRVAVVTEDGDSPVAAGDTVLMPSDQTHQFKNLSDTEPARLICLVPIQHQK